MTAEELQAWRTRLEAVLPSGAIREVQESGALVLRPEALLEAGRFLRDEEGFDYLSNVSGVDWLEQNEFEVVYHLYALRRGERMLTTGQPDGAPLAPGPSQESQLSVAASAEAKRVSAEGVLGPVVLKVRVPRDNPVVPSVTGLWLSALFQEREVYDMFGLHFEGHPNLKRIYLWDEYTDHPLRKDYVPEEA